MNDAQRERFDALVHEAVGELPEDFAAVLDEMPLVVLDEPTPEMIRDLGGDEADARDLMGLHTGIATTERSIEESGSLPSQIHIFRKGIVESLGGWEAIDADEEGEEALYEEILITLLHEIGHQLGLDEDDLEKLGYA